MDKLTVLNAPSNVVDGMRAVICELWSQGLQSEKISRVRGVEYFEFKLHGFPWYGQGDEAVTSRKLLAGIVAQMASLDWRLLSTTNLRGGADAFFFIDEVDRFRLSFCDHNLSVLSLNRCDRLRLIDMDDKTIRAVKMTINCEFQASEPELRDFYGAMEYKLKGLPFSATGQEAMSTKILICKIFESLAENGWICLTSFDISRKVTDKCTFVFEKYKPVMLNFACISMEKVDRVRLINFPAPICQILHDLIEQYYPPGIRSVKACDYQCIEIKLSGFPWTQVSTYSLQAKAMLTKVLPGLEKAGWRLVTSGDVCAKLRHQKNGPDYPVDVHSLFFCSQNYQ